MTSEKPDLEEITLLECLAKDMPEQKQKELYTAVLKIYSTALSYGAEIGRKMETGQLEREEEARVASRRVVQYLQSKAGKEAYFELYLK